MNEELEKYKIQIKENLNILINNNELEAAKDLIKEYKKIILDDIEIYSIEAIICILKGRYKEAELILDEGLGKDKENFDLNYNLAFLYKKMRKFNLSIKYYNNSLKKCNDRNLEKEIYSNLDILEKQKNNLEQKKKIVFFDKGDDKFIWDIINELSKEYEIKKITVKNIKEIDEWMEWADICWFEWCDELVAYGSKLPIAKKKNIICRIHGYEVYTNYIKQVNWKNIIQLIIVAPHIRRIFEENTRYIDKGKLKIDTVFCGINTDKYNLYEKKKGFNLGYLGYINFKKNIPLTLDIFKKLHDIDSRYKLHIAGEFQDARTLTYFKYFIKENNLEDSFVFYGWLNTEEKIKWFKNIDYMIISSIDEGLCFAAAEAMASGIKAILHNCEGIKDHYDKKYIFNNLDAAIEMILSKDYSSLEYRRFIEDNYSLNKELENIKNIISKL